MKKIPFVLIAILLLASFLRLWRLDEVPVSLFGDELDVGYHAYSILKTGRDYSGNFMPLHFQSLAEWRTPLYLYSAVPTVAIFGISPWGVRLPAAIFGILGVLLFYLLVGELFKATGLAASRHPLHLMAAFLLAISPWHIQYSRAGFEVTQMLALYLAGIYFFLRGLRNGRWLVTSAVFLALTPWVYSTAKLFLPLTILALILIWWRDLLKIPRKQVFTALAAFAIVIIPITWSTIFGGGTARFSYLSIFTDPTVVPQIGWDRLRDARVSDPTVAFGVQPNFIDRVFHNKLLYWGNTLVRNYLQSFSTQFLFIQGDLNLRHSPNEMGQLYKIETIFLLAGLAFFLVSPMNKKVKTFLIFWLLTAPIPAILTRDGGMHATRLFFLLPPLVLLVAFGVYYIWQESSLRWKKLVGVGILGAYLVTFTLYQHSFWVHYPWESERWWHTGWGESIKFAKEIENDYDKIIISTAGEPPWIFFAGWYEYPPKSWQENHPMPKTTIAGFGEISYIGKYYFGTAQSKSGIYSLHEVLDSKTLYLADAREFNVNFAREPGGIPLNLKMLKAVTYPSGEPAFYLLTLNPQSTTTQ